MKWMAFYFCAFLSSQSYGTIMFLYVIFVTHKSVLVFAVTSQHKLTDNDMNDKNITFEDLPKAMSWIMDK